MRDDSISDGARGKKRSSGLTHINELSGYHPRYANSPWSNSAYSNLHYTRKQILFGDRHAPCRENGEKHPISPPLRLNMLQATRTDPLGSIHEFVPPGHSPKILFPPFWSRPSQATFFFLGCPSVHRSSFFSLCTILPGGSLGSVTPSVEGRKSKVAGVCPSSCLPPMALFFCPSAPRSPSRSGQGKFLVASFFPTSYKVGSRQRADPSMQTQHFPIPAPFCRIHGRGRNSQLK